MTWGWKWQTSAPELLVVTSSRRSEYARTASSILWFIGLFQSGTVSPPRWRRAAHLISSRAGWSRCAHNSSSGTLALWALLSAGFWLELELERRAASSSTWLQLHLLSRCLLLPLPYLLLSLRSSRYIVFSAYISNVVELQPSRHIPLVQVGAPVRTPAVQHPLTYNPVQCLIEQTLPVTSLVPGVPDLLP